MPIALGMTRTRSTLAALALAAFASLALFAATASATFEATMAPRQASAREAGPTFVLEAGGGRRTRIRALSIEAGACGSIYAPLLNITKASRGFSNGNGAAVFGNSAQDLHLRLELRLKPRGEGLRGTGVFTATIGDCHERVPLDLLSTAIRGGGRHASG
jgi:hypothetical protein